jgi:antitoxin component YwqK of YwqJK toxin-antitoxin module
MRWIIFFSLSLVCCTIQIKKEYFDNGLLQEKTSLKNGLPHGDYEAFYENGNKRSEGNFRNGLMVGRWLYWYPDGAKMSESQFDTDGHLINLRAWDEDGKLTIENCTGEATLLYPNGQKLSKVEYKNCKPHGRWTNWYESGQIKSEFYYENGLPVGRWTYWNNDGTVDKIVNN